MATGNDPESSARADIQAKLDEAKANADKLKNDYENNLKPGLESLASSVAQAAQSLSARASQLSGVGDGLNGAASSVASDLAGAQSAIRAMSDELHGSADKMSALSQRVNEALASGNVEQLKQVIGSDPRLLPRRCPHLWGWSASPCSRWRTSALPWRRCIPRWHYGWGRC